MTTDLLQNVHAGRYSSHQQLFLRYSFAVLVDLAVLGLLAEFWDKVYFEAFSIMLLAAILLQFLLKVSIAIEHKVAGYFKSMSGLKAKVLRIFSTWLVLFGSKIVILKAISVAFGDKVVFHGAWHGMITFILVVIAIIVAEQLFVWVYNKLGINDL
ncbi:MAG: hypothetical protein ACWA5Q_09415 [bacterium]